MNSDQLAELAKLIATQQAINHWAFYAAFIALTVLSSAAGAFGASYLKKRGEIAAMTKDIEHLLDQQKRTAELVTSINTSIAHADWIKKERKTARIQKLEKLMELVLSIDEWETSMRNHYIFEPDQPATASPVRPISATVSMYFHDELGEVAHHLVQHCRDLEIQAMKHASPLIEIRAAIAVAKHEANVGELTKQTQNLTSAIQGYRDARLPLYKELLEKRSAFERAMRDLMQSEMNA